MNLADLTDKQLRSRDFPITRSKVFLAHAAASPYCSPVSEAIRGYCERNATDGQWEYLYGDIERELRHLAAELFGGSEQEIALVSSTSMGLAIVAAGLCWRHGDNVVIADGDFPANIYPWLNLKTEGVEIRFVPKHHDGSLYPEDLEKLVDVRTRLVSLSSVNYVTGFKIDIDAIGDFLHSRNILFCVDAVQSLGTIPFSSKYVDFAAGSAHKWLMGPMGIGLLFVKKENLEKLQCRLVGWKTVKENKHYLEYNLEFPDSARRYEMGSPNALGIVGLHAALKMLLEVGIENIARRLALLTLHLPGRLIEAGFELVSPPGTVRADGIVSFTSDKVDITRLRQSLDSLGFIVSLRETLDNRKCIRISPHFYNLEEEITALLDLLMTTTHQ